MRIAPGVWPALSALLDEYLDQPDAARAAWLANLGPEYADILPTLREVVSKGTARGDAFLDTLAAVARNVRGLVGNCSCCSQRTRRSARIASPANGGAAES